MAQPFNNAIITNGGARLITRAQAGEIKIEFTRIAIGNGNYSDDEKGIEPLQCQTALRSEQNSYPLSGVDIFSDHSVKITALITNQDPITGQALVDNGYFINEMGLFARVKDGEPDTEVLYSITVTTGTNGDFMPPFNGYYPVHIIQEYYATVNNSAEVTIQAGIGGVILTEDYLKLKTNVGIVDPSKGDLQTQLNSIVENVIQHIGDKENPHETDKYQVGLGNVDNTSDEDKPVSTLVQAALDALYKQLTGYTNEKIADLIGSAPSTLDTLEEIANAIQTNDNVVDALENAIGSKANAAEFDSHEIDNIKHITASERAKWDAKQETTGDAKDNTVTFTSDDVENPTVWTSMVLFKSREKLSSLFNKVSIMAKNVRYLYKMIGSTDISGIGGGTVTGALSQLNSNLTWKKIGSWHNTYVPNNDDIRKCKELYINIYWLNGWSVVSFFEFTTIPHESRLTLSSREQSVVVLYNLWNSELINIDSFRDKDYNIVETSDYTIDVYGR